MAAPAGEGAALNPFTAAAEDKATTGLRQAEAQARALFDAARSSRPSLEGATLDVGPRPRSISPVAAAAAVAAAVAATAVAGGQDPSAGAGVGGDGGAPALAAGRTHQANTGDTPLMAVVSDSGSSRTHSPAVPGKDVRLSVDDWLSFGSTPPSVAVQGAESPSLEDELGRGGGRHKRSKSLTSISSMLSLASMYDADLPPPPDEPAPPVPNMLPTPKLPARGHRRSQSVDSASFMLSVSPHQSTPHTPPPPLIKPRVRVMGSPLTARKASAAPKGTKQQVKDLQTAIQALRDRNNALVDLNTSLQHELVAVKGDRIFLQRLLEQRSLQQESSAPATSS